MTEKSPQTSEVSLYDRIGGAPAIDAMVADFYDHVLNDDELMPFFGGASMDKLRDMQKEFFSAALGGPTAYTGRPLSHIHHSIGVKRKHFARFVEHLLTTLQERGMEDSATKEIISRVNTYADEIVGGHGTDG